MQAHIDSSLDYALQLAAARTMNRQHARDAGGEHLQSATEGESVGRGPRSRAAHRGSRLVDKVEVERLPDLV